ncbi:branched-chain amino acid ABC transporter permease [Cellulomonas sp. Leaf395]|uniref:branched-chain amino acid ABC transporter permease n=1 Tax=Cellulomonas sp. Leaf395 TaxID=1736362 RepID=UPI0007016ADB|nr:branched-chain amino acid ABC transporter permease [Cellulomonas sp. Leaf395]KQS97394.1 ABC transporter permease [Cellulomonas sp. Leaf395]
MRSAVLDPGGTTSPPLARRIAALLLLALTFATLLLVASPARAQGPVASATAACVADATTGCIVGTLRTAAGEPVVGAVVNVVGPQGDLTATSDATGRWSVAVTEPGEYEVTLDVATIPAGETLRDPANNPRTVEVGLGASAAALFPLGAPAAGAGGGGDDGGEPSDAPTTGADGGAAVPTTPGSTGSGVTAARVAQLTVNGLVFGTLLALASVGLSLIYGTTGLSNFAHGEQVSLGGILAYVGTQLVGLPLIPSAIIAVALGAATGWLQDAGLWKPLRRRGVGMIQQMIVTIGLSMAISYVFQFFFGAGPLRIVTDTPTSVSIGPVRITTTTLWSLAIAVIVLAGVAYFLLGTRAGRATRAVADNPALSAASGISVNGMIRIVWTLGAGLAALGGVLIGLYFGATSWYSGGALLLLMFAAVTLGGLGAAFGALAGSIVIGLVVELSSLWIPTDMRYASALVILILVLLVRPQGILGRATRVG